MIAQLFGLPDELVLATLFGLVCALFVYISQEQSNRTTNPTKAAAGALAPVNDEVEVAIVGGNVMGLMTALLCADNCPEGTRIAVLERNSEPKSSVGESGLSSMSRAMQSVGLDLDLQSHLFALKSGLAFYHADDADMHVEVTNLDYSFQFDRRVLGLALQALCRRRGIDVRTSCHATPLAPPAAAAAKSTTPSMIHEDGWCHVKTNKQPLLRARALIDASGGATKMVKKQRYDHFNCNSVWSYFQAPKVGANKFKRFEFPTTKHIMFKEGWMWMIRVIDWNASPTDRLTEYIEDLFDRKEQGRDLLSIDEACEQFGLSNEYQYSVGFVIREDMDLPAGYSAEQRFQHWVDKYDLVRDTLSAFERVQPTKVYQRQGLAYYNPEPVQDGFTCVGDSVAFTNPFFSRGMNVGVVGCLTAAQAVAEGLRDGSNSMKFLSKPTGPRQQTLVQYCKEMPQTLGQDYRAWHSAFQSPSAVEAMLSRYIAIGVGTLESHYGDAEEVHGNADGTNKVAFDDELYATGLALPYVKQMFTDVSEAMIGYDQLCEKRRSTVDTTVRRLSNMAMETYRKESVRDCPQPYSLCMPGYDDALEPISLDQYNQLVNVSADTLNCFRRFGRCHYCTNWTAAPLGRCAKCNFDQGQMDITHHIPVVMAAA